VSQEEQVGPESRPAPTRLASVPAPGERAGDAVAQHVALAKGARFAAAKFRPAILPATLLTRPALHRRLDAGAGKRLTIVMGPAGTGKSVLLSGWAAGRAAGLTSWLSCDEADADPVRFWTAFIQAHQGLAPGFGAEAAELLAMDGSLSADVTASIANDAAHLPAGSATVVDDFHLTTAAAAAGLTDLLERWPAGSAQLVLAGRADPPLRLHRLRLSGELCELRDHDLYLSLPETDTLLSNFGVRVAPTDLTLLHERSEGWVAALQMAALTLRGATDPVQLARALNVQGHTMADYFVEEVLQQQPPEVARFMLETSVLDELTPDACAAVTGRQDAAILLRGLEAANLFVVALDDDRASYRYHHLVRDVLRTVLHATDRKRELELQHRTADWLESTGDTRGAIRHYFAAGQADRALALLQERVVADLLHDPAAPATLDLSMIDPALLTSVPERLLALATDLLLWGDWTQGGEWLDLLERTQPLIRPDSRLAFRLAVVQALRSALRGEAADVVRHARAAQRIEDRAQLADEWGFGVPVLLLRGYTWLEDFEAVDREAAAAQTVPSVTGSGRLVDVRGAQALAWFEAGHLNRAAEAARRSDADARRLGFEQHPFAVDYLRVLAGVALEQQDLDTAEQLTERALSISERFRPVFEFGALLDRARIWAARGQTHDALASVEVARLVLAGTESVLLPRADELEGLLRLALGDLRSATGLADRLAATPRGLLLARIALAAHDHLAAEQHLDLRLLGDLTTRAALMRQVLLATAAIGRGDPEAAGLVSGVLRTARQEGFLGTIVTTAPQLTRYLVDHSAQLRPEPFLDRIIEAAGKARSIQAQASRLAAPLTTAELRVLELLPTSTYVQMAATLFVSHNTVKTHLRSIYQKLGVSSRAEAIERAGELGLL
jgi:LuxR family transcriptional regulator, maltose regulon positive regulatory protein